MQGQNEIEGYRKDTNGARCGQSVTITLPSRISVSMCQAFRAKGLSDPPLSARTCHMERLRSITQLTSLLTSAFAQRSINSTLGGISPLGLVSARVAKIQLLIASGK